MLDLWNAIKFFHYFSNTGWIWYNNLSSSDIGDGAPESGSFPSSDFGKAITSAMLLHLHKMARILSIPIREKETLHIT